MRRAGVGRGPAVRCCPSPHRGPAQAPGRPAREEQRWQELAIRPIEPPSAQLVLQERPPDSHGAGQQRTHQAEADAVPQMPEPAWEGLVLPSSACSQLLAQDTRLQQVLQDLERQRSALEMENRLLSLRSSPEACKEAERLQQKSARLAALTKQLKERCRHLQETIGHFINTPVLLPIQSSAEELGMKSFLPQRAGETRDHARALLARDQQNGVSAKVAEELQAHLAADDEGSCYVSSLSQRCEELEVQLLEVTTENTRLAEENSRLRRQMRWAEMVQAENADLKDRLTRAAEQRNSTIRAISRLRTRLEAAERRLKAVRDTVESAQREVNRDHEEARQLFQAQVDEGGWSVGELADGTRGVIPSNFAEDASDDNLENKSCSGSHYYIFSLSPLLEEDGEDLDVGGGG